MSKLKDLTWGVHQQAERTDFARALLKGLTPTDYYRYLVNQYEIYSALEQAADKIIIQYPDIARADKIKLDIEELEVTYNFGTDPTIICPVVTQYQAYVTELDQSGLIAHLYVRHFGDMYGGQMIKKRNPGLGQMYEFDNVDELKTQFRALLNDSMAAEANQCFEFAIQLFKELHSE